jgi:hypothetical protein
LKGAAQRLQTKAFFQRRRELPGRRYSTDLTGYNSAYIAIAFPIFYPLIHPLPNYLYLVLCAYVIGFAGILVSPVHLCLVLTNEFFEAPPAAVYHYLAFPIAAMIGVATVINHNKRNKMRLISNIVIKSAINCAKCLTNTFSSARLRP